MRRADIGIKKGIQKTTELLQQRNRGLTQGLQEVEGEEKKHLVDKGNWT